MTLLLAAAAAAVAAVPCDVQVPVGQQKVLNLPGVSRIALSGVGVFDVKALGGGQVLVTGLTRGRSSLLWFDGKGGSSTCTVSVDDGRTTEVGRMLRQFVGSNLTVTEFSEFVVVDGTIDSVEDARRLDALVKDNPRVKVLARFNPRVVPVVAEIITAQFQRNGLANARASAIGQKVVLEGSVADEKEMLKALSIAQAVYDASFTR